jgi:hypothetical protein
MSEKEFWSYLNSLLSKGRMNMIAASFGCDTMQLNEVEMFMSGHAFLPQGYENISCADIQRMGMLLFGSGIQLRTKQAVLILLAHHPSQAALAILQRFNLFPDERLRIFTELALDECLMWNEEK